MRVAPKISGYRAQLDGRLRKWCLGFQLCELGKPIARDKRRNPTSHAPERCHVVPLDHRTALPFTRQRGGPLAVGSVLWVALIAVEERVAETNDRLHRNTRPGDTAQSLERRGCRSRRHAWLRMSRAADLSFCLFAEGAVISTWNGSWARGRM